MAGRKTRKTGGGAREKKWDGRAAWRAKAEAVRMERARKALQAARKQSEGAMNNLMASHSQLKRLVKCFIFRGQPQLFEDAFKTGFNGLPTTFKTKIANLFRLPETLKPLRIALTARRDAEEKSILAYAKTLPLSRSQRNAEQRKLLARNIELNIRAKQIALLERARESALAARAFARDFFRADEDYLLITRL